MITKRKALGLEQLSEELLSSTFYLSALHLWMFQNVAQV